MEKIVFKDHKLLLSGVILLMAPILGMNKL